MDKEKRREYMRDYMAKRRVNSTPEVNTNVNNSDEKLTETTKDVNTVNMIPVDQLVPTEPYDPQKALDHMMRMHPVYSDKFITMSGGVRCRPVIGWRDGEAWTPSPIVVKVDKAKLARLKKVIKDMELVKVV